MDMTADQRGPEHRRRSWSAMVQRTEHCRFNSAEAAPSLLGAHDELVALIEQYRSDLATPGASGKVRCAHCGDRFMPVEHVQERLAQLRALAFIDVKVDGIGGPDDLVAT